MKKIILILLSLILILIGCTATPTTSAATTYEYTKSIPIAEEEIEDEVIQAIQPNYDEEGTFEEMSVDDAPMSGTYKLWVGCEEVYGTEVTLGYSVKNAMGEVYNTGTISCTESSIIEGVEEGDTITYTVESSNNFVMASVYGEVVGTSEYYIDSINEDGTCTRSSGNTIEERDSSTAMPIECAEVNTDGKETNY